MLNYLITRTPPIMFCCLNFLIIEEQCSLKKNGLLKNKEKLART